MLVNERQHFARRICVASAPLVAACLIGCGDAPIYTCPDPSTSCDAVDAGLLPDAGPIGPDAGPIGPDAGPIDEACAGLCLPSPPDTWNGPTLLWSGKPDMIPACPAEAPHLAYEGHADLVDQPAACPTCTCAPPSGTCEPPATLTVNAAACMPDEAGVAQITLPIPAAPTCAAVGPLPASATCGTGPCLQSVTIAPPTLMETGCAPSTEAPPAPPPEPGAPSWGTAARACSQDRPGWCADPDTVCAPAVAPGFSTCLSAAGDRECPSEWPVKHVYYDGADDTRSCTPCTCEAPSGGSCSTFVSIYEDTGCSMLLKTEKVGSSGPLCSDIALEGSPPVAPSLGSAQVDKLTYTPGTCAASGGEPMGSLVPTGPTTFCCRP